MLPNGKVPHLSLKSAENEVLMDQNVPSEQSAPSEYSVIEKEFRHFSKQSVKKAAKISQEHWILNCFSIFLFPYKKGTAVGSSFSRQTIL